jgi:hypothetical protein
LPAFLKTSLYLHVILIFLLEEEIMASPRFTRLVRFVDPSGAIFFGEAADVKDLTQDGLVGQKVPVYKGDNPFSTELALTGETKEIAIVSFNSTYHAAGIR